MANREKDLKELKRFMDELFKRLKKAKRDDDKLNVMEVIQMTANDMARVVDMAKAE